MKAKVANCPGGGVGFVAAGADHANVEAPVEPAASQKTVSCPTFWLHTNAAVGGAFATVTLRVTVSVPAPLVTVSITVYVPGAA